jgi:hypothetical protein
MKNFENSKTLKDKHERLTDRSRELTMQIIKLKWELNK